MSAGLLERLHRDERGFGLVELLISMTILVIAVFAMYTAFDAGALALLRSSRTSTAATIGEKQLELYRGMLWSNIGLRAAGPNGSGLDSTDGTHQGDSDWVSQTAQTAAANCSSSSAPECQPTQSNITGPDGFKYRTDTYVRTLTAAGGGVYNGRDVKRVAVTVRKQEDQTKLLARVATTFDRATGCDGTTSNPC